MVANVDNRAGQETGYLFEPIIANAVGGAPIPAKKSPVKRHSNGKKGRQVDCLLDQSAYEIKLRVTIAASGQGRWREELDFPIDCKKSGYTPILVVLDSTPNPKLTELVAAFQKNGGKVYLGGDAWQHLESLAGPTMTKFLEMYVRAPIKRLMDEAPTTLPDFTARFANGNMTFVVDGEELVVVRHPSDAIDDEAMGEDPMPDDVSDGLPH